MANRLAIQCAISIAWKSFQISSFTFGQLLLLLFAHTITNSSPVYLCIFVSISALSIFHSPKRSYGFTSTSITFIEFRKRIISFYLFFFFYFAKKAKQSSHVSVLISVFCFLFSVFFLFSVCFCYIIAQHAY